MVCEEIHDLRHHVAVHSRAFADAMPVDVSIMTAVHNTPADYLHECWASIRRQTLRRWELVLIDDGSTDAGTIAAVDEIARDPRVRLVRLPENKGAAAARNAGLAECRADLVAVMDSDDVMLPERLRVQVDWMRSRPDVVVLGAQIEAFVSGAGTIQFTTSHPETPNAKTVAEQQNGREVWFINHPAAVYRKAAVLKIGGYPDYRVCQDLALWLRLLRAGAKFHNMSDVLVRYRLHPGQLTFSVPNRKADYAHVLATEWPRSKEAT